MLRPYKKPPLTFLQQLDQLLERGMEIGNPESAAATLARISYYRLSAYCYPFRSRSTSGQVLDQFVPNTTWEAVLALYEMDRRLRLLMLDAIERVEVAIRTQLTYHMAHKYGAFGHIITANFHPGFDHAGWRAQIESEIIRSSDEFIRHYRQQYDGFPSIPLWMLTEVMTLGSLSRLYRGLQHEDKKVIAGHFSVHHKRMGDWLHTLTYIRNVCAHHSRLWNRELAIRPDSVKDPTWRPPLTPRNDRLFYVLLILRQLLNAVSNGDDWRDQVNTLLYPIAQNQQWRIAMGMPEKWRDHPIWQG